MIRETDADELFRQQAEREGYLTPYGRGLWQWYVDNGMVPPEKLERRDRGPIIAELDPAAIDRVVSAGLDGSPLPRQNGRHSRPENGEW